MTSANLHHSQMLSMLLDPKIHDDYVWSDSAYSGQCFEDLLSLGSFKRRIDEKDPRKHPLSNEAKGLTFVKSANRASIKHVFGFMTPSMGGKLARKIGA